MLKAYLNYFKWYPFYLGIFLTIVPLVMLVIRRRQLTVAFSFLLAFLAWKFIVDLWMVYLAAYVRNNIFLANLNIVVRYLLLSGMVYHFYTSPVRKKWLKRVSLIFVMFFFWDVYVANADNDMHNHVFGRFSLIVESMLMILWILLYFYEILQSLQIKNLLRSPSFLVSAAWLAFYASQVFIAPLLYYSLRWDSTFKLGLLRLVPDAVEMLAILVIALAVSFIPRKTSYD